MKLSDKFYKHAAVILLITATLMLIPLIAMQFTNEVDWSLFDFLVAGTLLFGTGITYELLASQVNATIYRIAVGVAVGTSLLLIWVNLAVGILGSENNPANLMYGGVIAIGFIGAIIARLHPKGMSSTLFAMAFVQMLVPVIALLILKPQSDSIEAFLSTWHDKGIFGVFGVNVFFAILFAGSALLFRHAATKDKI